MSNNTVYELVTAKITEQLEHGVIPWRRPWTGGGAPRNAVSKREYSGVNVFLLGGYSCPYWGSFKQIGDLGGNVLKGEKGSLCVFWKMLESEDEVDADGKAKKIPLLRYYTVFNIAQTTLADDPRFAIETKQHDRIAETERIAADMPNRPTIEDKESRAYYRPSSDVVNVPALKYFESGEEYYSTLFHELAHSTGHAKRLNREGINEVAAFGTATYSKEELIAEMSAAYLCASCGIEHSAAYIGGWLRKLKDDRRLVVFAAAAAQKAADYVLNRKGE